MSVFTSGNYEEGFSMTSGAIGKCFGLVLDCLIVIGTQSEGFNNSIT